ncbi:hypothetical protein [Mollivirus kamchatka]|nr:hypothetical protein [Mollivirus kamchatka]
MEDLPEEIVEAVLEYCVDPPTAPLVKHVCRRWDRVANAIQKKRSPRKKSILKTYNTVPYTTVAIKCNASPSLLNWTLDSGYALDAAIFARAAATGDLPLLRRLKERGCPSDERATAAAIKARYFDVLEWLRDKGYPWGKSAWRELAKTGDIDMIERFLPAVGAACTSWLFEGAAAGGHLNGGHIKVIEWLKDRWALREESAFRGAGKKGQLEVIKWLYREELFDGSSLAWNEAAQAGHAHVTDWLRNEAFYIDELTFPKTALGGDLQLLQWLRSKQCGWDSRTFAAAAAGRGDIDVLKWLRAECCPWDSQTFVAAVGRGDIDVLAWLRAEGCPWDSRTFARAAAIGDIDVLEWLLLNECPWDMEAVARVAEYGNLHVLDWFTAKDFKTGATACAKDILGPIFHWRLSETRCMCDTILYRLAVKRNHLQVLQWLHDSGCLLHDSVASEAATEGRLVVLEWLHARGCPWNKYTCKAAAWGGHLEVLQWLKANGCPWDEQTCFGAASAGHLEVLQWARANNCPWDKTACAKASEVKHRRLFEWIETQP